MFATIGRSFRLVKLCLHVLSVDKELAFFPIFSSIGVVVVLLAFMGVSIGIGALDRIDEGAFNPGDIVVALLFYFLAYFVIIFFNSALVFAAHERLAGGDPNIRSGLRERHTASSPSSCGPRSRPPSGSFCRCSTAWRGSAVAFTASSAR